MASTPKPQNYVVIYPLPDLHPEGKEVLQEAFSNVVPGKL
jgi:hypothetical protein